MCVCVRGLIREKEFNSGKGSRIDFQRIILKGRGKEAMERRNYYWIKNREKQLL